MVCACHSSLALHLGRSRHEFVLERAVQRTITSTRDQEVSVQVGALRPCAAGKRRGTCSLRCAILWCCHDVKVTGLRDGRRAVVGERAALPHTRRDVFHEKTGA